MQTWCYVRKVFLGVKNEVSLIYSTLTGRFGNAILAQIANVCDLIQS